MKIKAIIAALLLLVSLACLATGCGKDKDAQTTTGQTEPSGIELPDLPIA